MRTRLFPPARGFSNHPCGQPRGGVWTTCGPPGDDSAQPWTNLGIRHGTSPETAPFPGNRHARAVWTKLHRRVCGRRPRAPAGVAEARLCPSVKPVIHKKSPAAGHSSHSSHTNPAGPDEGRGERVLGARGARPRVPRMRPCASANTPETVRFPPRPGRPPTLFPDTAPEKMWHRLPEPHRVLCGFAAVPQDASLRA